MTGAKLKKGFTVLEMVVVMSIFSVASVYSMSAYVKSNRGQKKIVAISKSTTDARYALETMVKEIRSGKIDYQMYDAKEINLASNEPVNDLFITDSNNNLIWFNLYQVDQTKSQIRVCYTIEACEEETWFDITPGNINISTFNVYIWPKADPFTFNIDTNDYDADEQPKVSLVIRSKSLDKNEVSPQEIHLQTTVSSRTYER